MIDNEKNILKEDELAGVSGGVQASAAGATNSQDKVDATEKHFCKKCNKDQVYIAYSGTRSVCSVCKTPWTF